MKVRWVITEPTRDDESDESPALWLKDEENFLFQLFYDYVIFLRFVRTLGTFYAPFVQQVVLNRSNSYHILVWNDTNIFTTSPAPKYKIKIFFIFRDNVDL